jgi:hypothetical protein
VPLDQEKLGLLRTKWIPTERHFRGGSNTATDHIAVLDAALAQIPDAYRHGHPILVRADGAGCTKAFLAHLRSLRSTGVSCEFSVGWTITAREHTAIATLRAGDWTAATDVDGEPRPVDEAAVAEITGLLPAATLAAYPPGTRVIVRRERPHPGAQLDLIEQADGYRYTALATDTRVGQHAFLDARHRAHAGSRTVFAPAATPAWAGCPADRSRSTPPG